MYYTAQFITENMRSGVIDISLDAADHAWNPTTPWDMIEGPCDLKYIRQENGEIDAYKARK